MMKLDVPMMTSEVRAVTRRGPLLLIAVLFLGPFIAAYVWYFYVPAVRPQGHVNYGELLQPARPLREFSGLNVSGQPVDAQVFQGKWTLVEIGGEHCDAACAQRLYLERQVRARLDRDRTRVQRVYVAPNAAALDDVRAQLGSEHPDLVWLVDRGAPGQRLVDFVGPQSEDALYLFDPLGNWVMRYPSDFAPAGVYKDLKQLLKLSGIG